MLKCGCRAVGSLVASDGTRVPYCVIHDCGEITSDPDVSGRTARCPQCGTVRESKLDLAFFQHRPDHEYDLYYCGCRGWD